MKVLVDTSVWVQHFKQRNEHLAMLLEGGWVVSHPYVVVEVACGTPPDRRQVVALLSALAPLPVTSPAELLALIEQRQLAGRGCGLVDVSLLAAALAGDALLWTLDKRLHTAASELGRAYQAAAAH
ncbi:MAG: PIN domain-containing protein [Burkholderiales bacterium]|nr:PIN domain-containing protein [Burkholderiales bacterium]